MAQTATDMFTSPMARKKRVMDKYEPNSYRVISVDAESIDFERSGFLPPLHSKTESNVIGQGPSGNRPAYGYRSNRPNPTNVNFLRHDVALLNEPVCNVYTSATHNNQANWWPHQSSTEPHAPAPYTFNTTVREDFQYHGAGVKRSTRHSCNPDKQPALGSVPVNFLRKSDGKQRLLKEGFSYEHQYNCRTDPQYPPRGKRHGAFVWDEFSPYETQKMLRHFGYVADKNEQTQPSSIGDKNSSTSSAASPPKTSSVSDVSPQVSKVE
ncbi:hypothetical protein CAPTEDRAFT_225399 [Capitella teleta]|uniref:Uncharacterized protein n=1 Tax=Capitella teleta TaxID=283909 RepID=R7UZJ2_CAPTE|nr:hypothetical protein CAPTEDRAFT_225399 [Capitella teleta]|eukprot:ELU08861.1 hypothetical protein CAPTEDRAFT_225399 [Capitella teleta]